MSGNENKLSRNSIISEKMAIKVWFSLHCGRINDRLETQWRAIQARGKGSVLVIECLSWCCYKCCSCCCVVLCCFCCVVDVESVVWRILVAKIPQTSGPQIGQGWASPKKLLIFVTMLCYVDWLIEQVRSSRPKPITISPTTAYRRQVFLTENWEKLRRIIEQLFTETE